MSVPQCWDVLASSEAGGSVSSEAGVGESSHLPLLEARSLLEARISVSKLAVSAILFWILGEHIGPQDTIMRGR